MQDIRLLNPLVLAYVGDGVFDLFVRHHIVLTKKVSVNIIHKTVTKYVSAPAQAYISRTLLSEFTEEETNIFKRGRNAKTTTTAKNASITDYRAATGLEAVFGFLYLICEQERLNHLMTRAIEIIENRKD